jgi:hypothetical protein
MVRDTSIEAYYDLIASGGMYTIEEKILHFLKFQEEPVSRLYVSNRTGMPINAVTGCVNPLVKEGLIIEVDERIACRITGRSVIGIVINPSVREYLRTYIN